MKKNSSNQFQSKNIDEIVKMLKALADPTRLKIMTELQDKELSVNEIVNLVGTGQANISKHLQVLSHANLLKSQKNGTSVLYSYSDKCIEKICEAVCNSYEKITKKKFQSFLE